MDSELQLRVVFSICASLQCTNCLSSEKTWLLIVDIGVVKSRLLLRTRDDLARAQLELRMYLQRMNAVGCMFIMPLHRDLLLKKTYIVDLRAVFY
jgi:hypothetical protein